MEKKVNLVTATGIAGGLVLAIAVAIWARLTALPEPTLADRTTYIFNEAQGIESYYVELPRLALAYYFFFALIAAAGLLALSLLMRRRPQISQMLKFAVCLPVAWLFATLAITGLSTATFTMERDLWFIAAATVPIFVALLFAVVEYQKRKLLTAELAPQVAE